MQTLIDNDSGFCFGVVEAIRIAETELQEPGELNCLGEMVHNEAELRRLGSLGMVTVSHDQIAGLGGKKLLIRAHGEPPATYLAAKETGVRLIDATCQVVLSLQKKIRKAWDQGRDNGVQIVIYGKPGHAEVIGLNGQTGNRAIIAERPDKTGLVNPDFPVELFSQTTMDEDGYARLEENLRKLLKGKQSLRVHRSICKQVSGRAESLRRFAAGVNVMVFVSGRNSSNGRALYQVCLEANPRSFMVSAKEEIEPHWFVGCHVAGISGATSTPRWLLEEVAGFIARPGFADLE
jgi:4-hydroxy-3-methylbut-2-enyl diphosphate reductase